jgi:F-type H+-transporting ATPase subunit beta
VAEIYTGKKGEYVALKETLEGCDKIVSGRFDSVAEDKFYMIGNVGQIEKVKEK